MAWCLHWGEQTAAIDCTVPNFGQTTNTSDSIAGNQNDRNHHDACLHDVRPDYSFDATLLNGRKIEIDRLRSPPIPTIIV